MTESPYRAREAESYDADRESELHWQREHDYVQALLARRAPRRMLDVPIGTGRFLALAGETTRVFGVDLSGAMLQLARRRAAQLPTVALMRGSVMELPFSRGTFDLTICCRLVHLLPTDQLVPVFAELARVTAGRVCVQAYVRGPLPWRLQSRLLRWARSLRSARRGTQAAPWAHIPAHFHTASDLLHAAAQAGLREHSRAQLARYQSTRVMMYEWDSPP